MAISLCLYLQDTFCIRCTNSYLLELLLLRAEDIPVTLTWLQVRSTKLGESFLGFGRAFLDASIKKPTLVTKKGETEADVEHVRAS